MSSRLQKLRKMSLQELAVRSSQAFAAFTERHSVSPLAKLPDDQKFFELFKTSGVGTAESLLDHFRTRITPRFFASFHSRDLTLETLQRVWPQAPATLIAEADRICEKRFDLLGLHNLFFGDPIDWHFEPLAEKRVPLIHWSRLDYLDSNLSGDKKIIWELNRHQYFSRLGQAYLLTKNEKYAEAFVSQLESWMNENPPKLGINWASSLEVAFRSISWLWAFYFFRDSPSLAPATFLRALKFLYLHARHLETYLSTYFSPNTHLTGEALGLFYLGLIFPEFKDAARWRERGLQILVEQLDHHVKADGVYFEQSSYYHRYTADFYTHLLVLLRANGQGVAPQIEHKLVMLLDHLLYITRPDGTTPLFGDDDGGRLVMLERRRSDDFRAPLATGAVIFNRADYKYVSHEPALDTLWLLGPNAVEEYEQLASHAPAQTSIAFRHGGYFVMRDGWDAEANFLLFDCGPHGVANCGHAHADALAIDVAASGRTVLVDPGTYTYTGSSNMRDWFRGTSAHNTLTLNGEPSSQPEGPFTWLSQAKCELADWIANKRFDYASGSHDGYERLATPATHRRSILFLRRDYWILRDSVISKGAQQADLWFHFAGDAEPKLRVTEDMAQAIDVTNEQKGLKIATFSPSGGWRREDGWISHCYAEGERAPVFAFTMATRASADLITFLLPLSAQAGVGSEAKEVEVIGGRAFEVSQPGSFDVVMIRDAGMPRVETARLASDFEWSWARFANENSEVPDELVLLGGQTLELQGKELLKSAHRLNWLVARRVDDHFRLETDEGLLDLTLPIHMASSFKTKSPDPKSKI